MPAAPPPDGTLFNWTVKITGVQALLDKNDHAYQKITFSNGKSYNHFPRMGNTPELGKWYKFVFTQNGQYRDLMSAELTEEPSAEAQIQSTAVEKDAPDWEAKDRRMARESAIKSSVAIVAALIAEDDAATQNTGDIVDLILSMAARFETFIYEPEHAGNNMPTTVAPANVAPLRAPERPVAAPPATPVVTPASAAAAQERIADKTASADMTYKIQQASAGLLKLTKKNVDEAANLLEVVSQRIVDGKTVPGIRSLRGVTDASLVNYIHARVLDLVAEAASEE